MVFELSKEELKKFRKWRDNLSVIQPDVFGEKYMFEFIFYPTGLGVIKKIKSADGVVLDLTNYDSW
jgi:hypothetical protein